MGVRRTIQQVSENIGAGTADFFDELANATQSFACDLWELFPDQITKNAGIGSNFARGFMNRACKDRTLVPVEPPPFQGGQCEGVLYDVDIRVIVYNQNSCNLQTDTTTTIQATGPIEGTQFTVKNPRFSTSSCFNLDDSPIDLGDWDLVSADGLTNIFANVTLDSERSSEPPLSSAEIVEIRRVDGLPDDCGSQDPRYPVTEPEPSDYTTIIVIPTEDGGDLTYNLTYEPTLYSFPMEFNLGDINITLDLNGFEFNFQPITVNNDNTDLPNGQDSPLPAPRDDDKRNAPQRRIVPPSDVDPNDPASPYRRVVRMPEDPPVEETEEEIALVLLTLTETAANAKTQFGDGADDVIYAGWFEWRSDTYNFPRQPIHFEFNVFTPPQGSNGFAYTLYEGYNGFAEIITIKSEDDDNGNI